jgi:dTDP-4-dehydrorhamnose 3,5-epimerase
MKIEPLPLEGAAVVTPAFLEDARGYFARTFDRDTFTAAGMECSFPQWSISHNRKRGTVRGMHFQARPWEETKLVSCVRGAVHDVLLDLRPGSATYEKWTAVELRGATPALVYIPAGVAHGFQTLDDDTLVMYHISELFHPEAARGVCWDDASFDIRWPLEVSCISEKDRSFAAWASRPERT